MLQGFRLEYIDTGEASLRVRYGEDGPPLLLSRRHPQTHVCWHRVAPGLAEEAPDEVFTNLHTFFSGGV